MPIIVPRAGRWTRQPQGPLVVDRGHFFGQNLEYAWMPTPTADRYGLGKAIGGGGYYTTTTTGTGTDPLGRGVAARKFTVALILSYPAASQGVAQSLFRIGASGGIRLDASTTGGGCYAQWTANGVANGDGSFRDGTAAFADRPVLLVSDWTTSGASHWMFGLGGFAFGGGGGTTAWTDSLAWTDPSAGEQIEVSSNGASGPLLYGAFIASGNIGAAGAAELARNPYAFFLRRPTRFYMLPAAAGGTTTITPSAGSITTSGLAPQLAAKVATGLGSISTTGYAPRAIRVSVMTPGVGAIAVSGLAPTASQIIGRVPGVGAITVAGLSPTVTQQIGRVPVVGAIAVTGYAPSTGGAIAITPGVGSISVTGLAAQLRSTVVPGVGAIATTGYTPVLNGALTIQSGVGSISVSGLASSLISLVGVQAGAIAFQGYQPGVTRGFVVTPGVGSITVTGLAGTLRSTVVPGVGAITVQGQSAAQQGTTTITPGVGAITVSGLAPTRAIVSFITPNVGIASVAGYAPVVAWTDNHTIAVPAGAITVTGYAPRPDAAGALDEPRFSQTIRSTSRRIGGNAVSSTRRIGGPIQ